MDASRSNIRGESNMNYLFYKQIKKANGTLLWTIRTIRRLTIQLHWYATLHPFSVCVSASDGLVYNLSIGRHIIVDTHIRLLNATAIGPVDQLMTVKTSKSASFDKGPETSQSTPTSDDAFLSSLGYEQVFKRQFTKLELFGVGFSIIGVMPSIASTFIFALPNGGPVAIVWGVCQKTCNAPGSDIFTNPVGHLRIFCMLYRTCYGWTWVRNAHIRWPVLLDVLAVIRAA